VLPVERIFRFTVTWQGKVRVVLFTLESCIEEAVFVTAVKVYRCRVNTKLGKQQQSEPCVLLFSRYLMPHVSTSCTNPSTSNTNTRRELAVVSIKTMLLYVLQILPSSTEQSPSWEANRFSKIQERSRILWTSKVHYRIHNSQPPVHFLSQISPIRVSSSPFLKIHYNIILPPGSFTTLRTNV